MFGLELSFIWAGIIGMVAATRLTLLLASHSWVLAASDIATLA